MNDYKSAGGKADFNLCNRAATKYLRSRGTVLMACAQQVGFDFSLDSAAHPVLLASRLAMPKSNLVMLNNATNGCKQQPS